MPRCAEFYTQKQNGVSLPLHAGSLSQSSQAPTSIGSTLPQSAHRADSPLSEGAKVSAGGLSTHHHKILFYNHKIILDNHITM